MGHVPGSLVFALGSDLSRGILEWTGSPRFSNGYGDVRHLPTILVENHSLKPYPQRVLGTYVFLESLLDVLAREDEALRRAVSADIARRRLEVPLTWKPGTQITKDDFLGVDLRIEPSEISGGDKVIWTGEAKTMEVPVTVFDAPDVTVKRPRAYLVPPAWRDVVERLEIHGVEMERLAAPRELEVEMYRLEDAELADEPFEGHVRVSARPVVERRRESFPAGTVRIPTDQPLGDLAILLLEPASPDSLFQWGFFMSVLQCTEYIEGYVIEPMAERMLAEDPALREAFEAKLAADEGFRDDPRARLRFFYERTPFFDERCRLYPVAREP